MKRILAAAMAVLLSVSTFSGVPSVNSAQVCAAEQEAETHSDQKAESPITYAVVTHPTLKAGETQQILVGVDPKEKTKDAVLSIRNEATGKLEAVPADTPEEDALLFESEAEENGSYCVESIRLLSEEETEAEIYFAELGMENMRYGVGTEVAGAPDAVAVPQSEVDASEEKKAASIEGEVVTFDEKGEVTSENTISEALADSVEETENANREKKDSLTGALTQIKNLTNVKAASKTYKVVLDPGHDDKHAGAAANDLHEEKITLKIANYAKAELERYSNIKVYMTRTSGSCPYPSAASSSGDNGSRCDYAKSVGADIYVSIHLNVGGSDAANGAEVYYPATTSSYNLSTANNGKALATQIQNKLNTLVDNRGIKTRVSNSNKYPDGSAKDYYLVINRNRLNGIPAVIVEHAFLTGSKDAAFLKKEANIKKLGLADAEGILQYFGISLLPDEGTAAGPVMKSITKSDFNSITTTWEGTQGASGYYVFRSTSESGTYSQIKQTTATQYTDTTCKPGSTYYYKVASYSSTAMSKKSDKALSAKSPARKVTGFAVKSGTFNRNVLSWTPVENATGYYIYRKTTAEGASYSRLAEVSGQKTASYNDDTAVCGKSYYYTVKAVKANGSKVYAGLKCADKKKTTAANKPAFTVTQGSFNAVQIDWKSVEGADGYRVMRRVAGKSAYTKLYKETASKNEKSYSFIDRKAASGVVYEYLVQAYRTVGKNNYLSKAAGAQKTITVQTNLPAVDEPQEVEGGIKITWSSVKDATHYKVLRRDSLTASWTGIKLLTAPTLTFTDTSALTGKNYYYTVRAYVKDSTGTYYGKLDNVGVYYEGNPSTVVTAPNTGTDTTTAGLYAITGKTTVTAKQMASFYNSQGKTYPADVYKEKGAATITDFAKICIEEANAEGIKAEVLFGQICLETGYLSFAGSSVSVNQCNFGGIGATGAIDPTTGKAVCGETYADVRTGLRAQVQHLKAYANTAALKQACVDTRFKYVTRGISPYVEWLGIQENPNHVGWASGANYGSIIVKLINQMKAF